MQILLGVYLVSVLLCLIVMVRYAEDFCRDLLTRPQAAWLDKNYTPFKAQIVVFMYAWGCLIGLSILPGFNLYGAWRVSKFYDSDRAARALS